MEAPPGPLGPPPDYEAALAAGPAAPPTNPIGPRAAGTCSLMLGDPLIWPTGLLYPTSIWTLWFIDLMSPSLPPQIMNLRPTIAWQQAYPRMSRQGYIFFSYHIYFQSQPSLLISLPFHTRCVCNTSSPLKKSRIKKSVSSQPSHLDQAEQLKEKLLAGDVEDQREEPAPSRRSRRNSPSVENEKLEKIIP